MFENNLRDHVPICHCSIAGTRLIGRLSAGNRKGLLLPNTCTDQELQHIRNTLPDSKRENPNEHGGKEKRRQRGTSEDPRTLL